MTTAVGILRALFAMLLAFMGLAVVASDWAR